TAACVHGACVETLDPDGASCDDADSLRVAGACVAPGCGNGFREIGEGCDDGNLLAGDACSPACEPTVFAVSARAGESDRPGGPRRAVGVDSHGGVLVVWLASQADDSF